MLLRRCLLCCDTSITRSWPGQRVSSSALKVAKPWRVGFLNDSLRPSRISSYTGETVWSARLPDGSRVRRESHARFCERPMVQFHRPTQPGCAWAGSGTRRHVIAIDVVIPFILPFLAVQFFLFVIFFVPAVLLFLL